MKQFSPSTYKRDISSEWLRALVEYSIDAIVTMDNKGRIIAFNPAAEKIFGYRSSQVIGHLVSDMLIPKSVRAAHEKGLARYLKTGKEIMIGKRVEVTAMRANKSIFPAEIAVMSITPKEGPVFIAYIRDITEQKQAEKERAMYAHNIKKTLLQTILAISRAIEIRDPYTAGHQRRVAHFAATIAQELNLSTDQIEGIFFGALIHDIGKLAIPSEILSRPGKLQEEDVRYIKTHCSKGYDILKNIDFPWPVAQIALQHHEHLDGTGYPQGLRDGEISLEARIVCVADVVESLISHRPYRPAHKIEETLEYITNRSGTWYDPRVASACHQLFRKGYSIETINMDELIGI